MSSDLDDSPEIWQGELGNYILETHKRQKQIDAFFNRWIIVCLHLQSLRMQGRR